MRKSIEYLVEEGDDKGKVFVITRMSAFEADEWASDLIHALSKAESKLRDTGSKMGMASLEGMTIDLLGALDPKDRKKAFADLLACCKIKRDPRNPLVEATKILEVDIEDPMTFIHLREKALSLHVDFIKAAAYQPFLFVAALIPEEKASKENV
ncbi:hypothetical protein FAI40_04725 [Acetobacteraceae bacterium]|nr:hypothetical protein FAI40_04580 [Acetobacteraceae bacterium]QCE34711.1 hypothetical protein FAI40_04725 [Acetobacteraceae bacterium]